MSSASEIILVYVCPSLGLMVANMMFLAPFRDLQKAVRIGLGLGDLNPTPWAFMLGNCLGWSAYGVLINNWFVFWANYPGFLIACWLNLGAVKLLYSSHHQNEMRRSIVQHLSSQEASQLLVAADPLELDPSCIPAGNGDSFETGKEDSRDGFPPEKEAPSRKGLLKEGEDWAKIVWEVTSQTTPAKTPHENLIMGMIVLWTLVLGTIGFHGHFYKDSASIDDTGRMEESTFGPTVVGYVVNLNLVFFYGAPLSSILRVVRSKRSDSLHGPTMIMNTSNSIFWTAYALAPQVMDPFIYVPNGLGVILGVIQFGLWAVFPRSRDAPEKPTINSESSMTNEQDSTPTEDTA